jgi:hypothetical protein
VKRWKLLPGLLLLLAVVTAGLVAAQTGGTFDLTWSTVDGGGALDLSGGSFVLHGTAGQPDAGVVSGGTFALDGGFWHGAGGGPTTTFDLTWSTVDGGGALDLSGGTFTLHGTAGQPDAGVVSGGTFVLQGGFWHGSGAVPATAFDMIWSTVDGGGALDLSGGTFGLHGTAGQPDAGALNGGTFEMDGGFWSGAGGVPTAVTLISFTAIAGDEATRLGWETATEVDLLGFDLYRAGAAGGSLTRLNAALIPVQHPGSPAGAVYEYADAGVEPGAAYWYWLDAIDVHGQAARHGPVSVQVPPGGQYRIYLPLVSK